MKVYITYTYILYMNTFVCICMHVRGKNTVILCVEFVNIGTAGYLACSELEKNPKTVLLSVSVLES